MKITCYTVCKVLLYVCVSQDDEGREVAIKIDRLDSKKFSVETATKSYIEVSEEKHREG